MISSLTSKFEFANRRALLLGAHKATVYHWHKGEIGSSYIFDANEEGREQFSRYLHETAKTPLTIIVDVFEEEYRHDTIPHVFGPDRAALVDRKQDRLFRDTPYRFFKVQGREESGRKDDRILLSAVTNPNLLAPWIAMLDQNKVPLSGIQSLPMFSDKVLDLVEDKPDHALIVSLQSISGLRQTFFSNGEFQISRLIQMPRYGTQPYAPYISDEVEKIRRYLNSLRVMSEDQSLDIYFLATGELLNELKETHSDEGGIRYHLIDNNELLKNARSSQSTSTPFSDLVYVLQVLKNKPENCYASQTDMRYAVMRKMRYGMLLASMLLVLGSVGWGGYQFFSGIGLKQQSIAALNKFNFYTARYQMAKERLQKTPVEPVDLKTAVELADKLSEYKTSPLSTVKVISGSLNKFTQLKLRNVLWESSSDPNVEQDEGSAVQNDLGFSTVSTTETGYKFYQIGIFNGYIDPFNGNYRMAINTINEFVEHLRTQKNVHDVSILSLPLDVSSEASMQGTTQVESKEANFSVRIVLGVKNEA